ncbi:MAG: BMP family lipoprotein [Candidatus Dormibacteria bacterium]
MTTQPLGEVTPRRARGRLGSYVLAGGTVLAVLAAGCGPARSSPPTKATRLASSSFLGCMVTDTGGIDDRSFNASSWQGMQLAAKADKNVKVKYLQSTNSSDYVPNISAFEQQNCGIIVTVGFLMATATQNAAQSNPNQKFAIVDYTYSPALSNVLGLHYDTDQDAFLGGYLAAALSKSGKVGTFGGDNIPTVTIYMSGFVAGVRYYNQHNHKHVKVFGWNPNSNTGLFTGNFTSQADGRLDATSLMNQGADIIFPVAGSVGLGAAAAVKAAGGSHYMEWVDVDGCVSAPQYCKLFVTSVTKGIAPSVKAAVLSAAKGTFKGGNYNGTLKDNGVGLSPYHDFSGKVPSSLKKQINTLKAKIIAGKISTNPLKYPAS